jgi:hypothetical protein
VRNTSGAAAPETPNKPGAERREPTRDTPETVNLKTDKAHPPPTTHDQGTARERCGDRQAGLMPHWHPEDRVYTVISGIFYIGLGKQFDDGKLEAYPPGTDIVLPGGTPHFHWAKPGEYVTQVTTIGPLGLEYLDPKDDPRNS